MLYVFVLRIATITDLPKGNELLCERFSEHVQPGRGRHHGFFEDDDRFRDHEEGVSLFRCFGDFICTSADRLKVHHDSRANDLLKNHKNITIGLTKETLMANIDNLV